ncbi:MAG: uroporphyrinogen decarboxylase [Capnocytophaga sp.]|nr:uroporphyrinogen decarboxylase [Capnocytophaga sp.]
MNQEMVQYIGYLASVFIILSFIVKDLKTLRIINLIGCVCFVIYGLLNTELLLPVIIPNAIICVVQIYHLVNKGK